MSKQYNVILAQPFVGGYAVFGPLPVGLRVLGVRLSLYEANTNPGFPPNYAATYAAVRVSAFGDQPRGSVVNLGHFLRGRILTGIDLLNAAEGLSIYIPLRPSWDDATLTPVAWVGAKQEEIAILWESTPQESVLIVRAQATGFACLVIDPASIPLLKDSPDE